MKLTFKRREVKSLHDLGTLVGENADAIEPGLQILASSLHLGRTSVDLAAIDCSHTPVLIALALTADDALLEGARSVRVVPRVSGVGAAPRPRDGAPWL